MSITNCCNYYIGEVCLLKLSRRFIIKFLTARSETATARSLAVLNLYLSTYATRVQFKHDRNGDIFAEGSPVYVQAVMQDNYVRGNLIGLLPASVHFCFTINQWVMCNWVNASAITLPWQRVYNSTGGYPSAHRSGMPVCLVDSCWSNRGPAFSFDNTVSHFDRRVDFATAMICVQLKSSVTYIVSRNRIFLCWYMLNILICVWSLRQIKRAKLV